MSRVIPEEGDKGRSEPAPDHHQGPAELSTRRWYPEQPYPSQPDNSMGRIKKWPLPRIIVIDSSHIADFHSHPCSYLLIANLHLPRIPRPSPQRRAHRQSVYRRYSLPFLFSYLLITNQHLPLITRPSPERQAHREAHASPPLHDRLIHCLAPSRPGCAFTASSTVAAGRVSQAADCAENSPQRPSFGQTGRKAIFPWNGGLTPVRGIINIRSVSTRQAIPP